MYFSLVFNSEKIHGNLEDLFQENEWWVQFTHL